MLQTNLLIHVDLISSYCLVARFSSSRSFFFFLLFFNFGLVSSVFFFLFFSYSLWCFILLTVSTYLSQRTARPHPEQSVHSTVASFALYPLCLPLAPPLGIGYLAQRWHPARCRLPVIRSRPICLGKRDSSRGEGSSSCGFFIMLAGRLRSTAQGRGSFWNLECWFCFWGIRLKGSRVQF